MVKRLMMGKVKAYMIAQMMDCDRATFLINNSDHMQMNCYTKLSLNFHLLTCKYCRRYKQQTNAINLHIESLKNSFDGGELIFKLSLKEKEELASALD